MLFLECAKLDYWGPAFVVPLLSTIFVLILVLISLRTLFHSYRDADPLRKPILRTASVLITFLCLVYLHFPTFRYGIFLPMVSEEDTQYRLGSVTSVTEVPFSPRYSIGDDPKTYRASLVRIDEDVFYFLNAEGLEMGEEIEITYLPQCNMVLSCQVVDN